MIDDNRLTALKKLVDEKLAAISPLVKDVTWKSDIERHAFIATHRDHIHQIVSAPTDEVLTAIAQVSLPSADDNFRLLSVLEARLSQVSDLLGMLLHSSMMTIDDLSFLAGFLHNLRPDDYWWKMEVANLWD